MVHRDTTFSIYFGDAQRKFIPTHFYGMNSQQLCMQDPFNDIQKLIPFGDLAFLHQTHGVSGLSLDNQKQVEKLNSFAQDGDFLITALQGLGIGVVTADCLPLILHDKRQQIVSIIHAGWRGSVGLIAHKALQAMEKHYGCKTQDISVFFGPCAKVCCYSVGGEMVNSVLQSEFAPKVLRTVGQTQFFDIPLFNALQLIAQGIKRESFNFNYNICTLCTPSFCSFRRQKDGYRQATIVALNKAKII